MKTILYPANERGHANHGWLNAYHSFSFANWYHPDKVNFGVLRVLNDDTIAPGMGFGTHPHDNMEIITIPLEGDLAHKDSMENHSIIKHGEIQVMSAGTGIQHSEFNPNADKQTKLFQIWLFPNKQNVTPRYQQMSIDKPDLFNEWQQILSPNPEDDGVWIHQNAWFHLGKFNQSQEISYTWKDTTNGLYVMVMQGITIVNAQVLTHRDAIGIYGTNEITFQVQEGTQLLLLEVPMQIS